MAVIEDFESVADWTDIVNTGSRNIQGVVRVVGNAVEYDGTDLKSFKDFDEDSYGIYIRTNSATEADAVAIQVTNSAQLGLIYVYAGGNGNFWVTTGDHNWFDTSVTFSVNTWYWIGVVRNADHDVDLRIYNEAKTVLLYSEIGVDNRDGRTWSTGDSGIITASHSGGAAIKSYFDQLTDDGSAPAPAAGATLNMKGYW